MSGLREAELKLNKAQAAFLFELNTKFRAYVGGFGSGKTFVGCLDLLIFMSDYVDVLQGYFGPSNKSIEDTFFPTFDEAAWYFGYRCRFTHGPRPSVKVFKRRKKVGHIICRSMDRPESIHGFKIARALVDEIDTLSTNKAEQSWYKIIPRLRLLIDGVINGIGVTCTPEGFLWVYKNFKEDPSASYSMVQASTYQNLENLPPDYIDTLYETYPSQLVEAYINGEFVNLKSGSVYQFNRNKHNHKWTEKKGHMLIMGNDFNVQRTCAVIGQMDDGVLRIYKEYVNLYDTPTLIKAIQEDYPVMPSITSYPDASGNHRNSSNASISDHAIMRKIAVVRADKTNPAIKDRYISVNKAFMDGNLTIDVEKCPYLTKALEQQIFDKNGLPEKGTGLDDIVDSLGYPVYKHFPIVKPQFYFGRQAA